MQCLKIRTESQELTPLTPNSRVTAVVASRRAAPTSWRLQQLHNQRLRHFWPVHATPSSKPPAVRIIKDAPPPPLTTDWAARAMQRDAEEICQAARKAKLSDAYVRDNIALLQTLLPGFSPSLFAMKASAWAQLLQDGSGLTTAILGLKAAYPGVDAGKMVTKLPQLLSADPAQVSEDARVVRGLLSALPDEQFAAVLEAVPSLTSAMTASRCLATLRSTYPGSDPVQLLASDPAKVLADEPDEPADAEYGDEYWSVSG